MHIPSQPPVLHRNWHRRNGPLCTRRTGHLRARGLRRRGCSRLRRRDRSRPHRRRQRRPLQQLQFVALRQPVEPLRLPARLQVQVHLIPHHRGCHRRIGLVRLGQRQERVKDLLRRHRLLLDPALLALVRLHPVESSSVLQHLQLLPVFHGPGAVGDRRHAVAQKRLLRRHIHILGSRLRAQTRAPAQQHQAHRSCGRESRAAPAAVPSTPEKSSKTGHLGSKSQRKIQAIVRHIFQHTARRAQATLLPVPSAVPPSSSAVFPRKMLPPATFCGSPQPAQPTLLAGCIPALKLQSCAKCHLAHTVAYGNKLNTGNHSKRFPESNSVRSHNLFVPITRQLVRRPTQWPVM